MTRWSSRPDSAQLAGAVNVALQSICPGVSIGHGVSGTGLRCYRGRDLNPHKREISDR
jgi:hypothetical protein